jgi:HK97 family phage portal protein
MSDEFSYTVTTNAVSPTGAVESPRGESTLRAQSPFNQYLKNRSAGFAGATNSKVNVNETTAMSFAAVFSSIRVISESKASLPIKVYEVDKNGNETQTRSHPVAELLSIAPNSDQTPMVFQEFQQSQILSRGNSYAQIHFQPNGEISHLESIHPESIEIGRNNAGSIMYRVTDNGANPRILDQSQVLHVPGMGGDGFTGWSPIRLAAESIGIGLANERFAAKYFGEFARPSIIVESEDELGPDKYDTLQNALNTNYSGDKVGGALLLEGALKAKTVSIPLNECQFLESREFQGKEIACRWYRIPAQIAGYGDDAKYDHMEQADLYFAKHTLGPAITRDEQEWRRKLFRPSERGRFVIKHNLDALQRADIKTRYEAHASSIMAGWKLRNEVRRLEDLNPIEGGDEAILPASVFGNVKPETDTGNKKRTGSEGIQRDPKGSDPRLELMVRRSVDGLVSREITTIERAKPKPDANSRLDAFYEKQRTLFRERFAGIVGDNSAAQIDAIVARHCSEAKRASNSSKLAGNWEHDAAQITALILSPSQIEVP